MQIFFCWSKAPEPRLWWLVKWDEKEREDAVERLAVLLSPTPTISFCSRFRWESFFPCPFQIVCLRNPKMLMRLERERESAVAGAVRKDDADSADDGVKEEVTPWVEQHLILCSAGGGRVLGKSQQGTTSKETRVPRRWWWILVPRVSLSFSWTPWVHLSPTSPT